VSKQTLPGNKTAWVESSAPTAETEFGHLLIKARRFLSIVLTHDCQLDKFKRKPRVQLASVSLVDDLNPEEKTKVMNQASLSLLVLPDVPTLGACYADLRTIITVDRGLIDEPMRIASMTEEAKFRLQNQVIAYFSDRARPEQSSS
jgi:hypothetical protein